MPLSDSQCSQLFNGLETIGWSREGDFIYSPNKQMWLLISCPWMEDLHDFHERTSARLARISLTPNFYKDKVGDQHQKIMDDTAGLVQVLSEMISPKQDDRITLTTP